VCRFQNRNRPRGGVDRTGVGQLDHRDTTRGENDGGDRVEGDPPARATSEDAHAERSAELALRRSLGRMNLDEANRLVEAFQALDPPEAVGDTFGLPRQLDDGVAREHL
jgi:hypothetical protein